VGLFPTFFAGSFYLKTGPGTKSILPLLRFIQKFPQLVLELLVVFGLFSRYKSLECLSRLELDSSNIGSFY